MYLLFLQDLIPEGLAGRLGWMLFHSLWQGVVAAALAGIIILCTSRSSARVRFNLLFVVLVSFIAGTVITFFVETPGTVNKEELLNLANSKTTSGKLLIDTGELAINDSAASSQFIKYIDTHSRTIVFCWFVLFLFHCVRLSVGVNAIERMRKTAVTTALPEWQARMRVLSKRMGIRRIIPLLQSELVNVPIAIGMLKPVVLIPVGLLTQLTCEQVESILLHELAHIRRRDYLVNIFQRITEAVFFFNPGLRWLSSLLRQEREACCDDLVVANTSHRSSYLEALVSFQEYQLSRSHYAMAIGTKQQHLLNRVRRMLTRENKKLNLMEKTLLIAGLTCMMAFGVISTKETKEARPMPSTVLVLDTVPANKAGYYELSFVSVSANSEMVGQDKLEKIVAVDKQGKRYNIEKKNGALSSFAIDGKNIPLGELATTYPGLYERVEESIQEQKLSLEKAMVDRKENSLKLQADREQELKLQRKKIELDRSDASAEDIEKRIQELKSKKMENDREREENPEQLKERRELLKKKIERKEKGENIEMLKKELRDLEVKESSGEWLKELKKEEWTKEEKQKIEKAEKLEKIEKEEKPLKLQKIEKEKALKLEKIEKEEKAEKLEKPEKLEPLKLQKIEKEKSLKLEKVEKEEKSLKLDKPEKAEREEAVNKEVSLKLKLQDAKLEERKLELRQKLEINKKIETEQKIDLKQRVELENGLSLSELKFRNQYDVKLTVPLKLRTDLKFRTNYKIATPVIKSDTKLKLYPEKG